jgi:hypothetical protein
LCFKIPIQRPTYVVFLFRAARLTSFLHAVGRGGLNHQRVQKTIIEARLADAVSVLDDKGFRKQGSTGRRLL